MKVQELMRTDVKSCGPADTLNRAAQLMWEANCGCVVVVDDKGSVTGMLTDRDICMAAYTQGKPLYELPAFLAMSKTVYCVRADDNVSEAEALIQEKQIRRLPVVDAAGRPVGLLSLNDIARQAARERGKKHKSVTDAEVGETLAAVCEGRAPTSMKTEKPKTAAATS